MNLVELILKALKLKAKSLGFNEDELKSVAAVCAANLTVTEETEESERDAAINKMVDEVAIPILKSSQSASGRAIEAYKKAHPATDPKKPGEEDTEPGKKKPGEGKETDDETPAWAKALVTRIESLEQENSDLRSQRVSTGRKERLSELVKGTGRFGENFLKNFDRMSFKDDADFDAYLASVKEEVDGYKQDLSDRGLESLNTPPNPDKSKEVDKKLTKEEIKAVAGAIH